jgi:hypothetical protein
MNQNVKRKIGAWGLFLLFLLFLELGATSYWKMADVAYMSVGIAFFSVMSILVVRRRWRKAHSQAEEFSETTPDAGDRVLRAVGRWCGGDKNP